MALRAAGGGSTTTSSGSALSPVILGAGPTAITHADHSNRGVSSVQALPTSVVFAVTATSGALDEDLVTIDNLGLGIMTASGNIVCPPGTKAWAARGETLIFFYNAAANKYYSRTTDIRKSGREPSFCTQPASNSSSLVAVGVNAHTMLDGSTLAGLASAATTRYTHYPRIAINASATTASRFPGLWVANTNVALRTPTATIIYGWKLRVVGGINDAYGAGTPGTFCMGFGPTAPSAAEPSTFLNGIHFGGDSTDANMQIMYNNAAGTMTKIDLGASFPNYTNALDLYEFTVEFYSDGVSRFCNTVAVNLSSGVEAYNAISGAELPAEGVAVGPFISRSNLAQTGTTASVHFGGFYTGVFA